MTDANMCQESTSGQLWDCYFCRKMMVMKEGGLTEQNELDRLLASASSACVSYVYVMRSRS